MVVQAATDRVLLHGQSRQCSRRRRYSRGYWLRKLMDDPGERDHAVPISEDNQACLALISNPEGTGRAKHIDTSHHLVRERTAMGAVTFYHRPGAETVEDGMTKALSALALQGFREKLEMAGASVPTLSAESTA